MICGQDKSWNIVEIEERDVIDHEVRRCNKETCKEEVYWSKDGSVNVSENGSPRYTYDGCDGEAIRIKKNGRKKILEDLEKDYEWSGEYTTERKKLKGKRYDSDHGKLDDKIEWWRIPRNHEVVNGEWEEKRSVSYEMRGTSQEWKLECYHEGKWYSEEG